MDNYCFIADLSEEEIVTKRHTTLPNGSPEIIINLGEDYNRIITVDNKREINTVVQESSITFIGQKNIPVKIHQSGKCDLIIVRLKPYGLYYLSDWYQPELVNSSINHTQLPGKIAALAGKLIPLLSVSPDLKVREFLVEYFLNELRKMCQKKEDFQIGKIVDEIHRWSGTLQINQICDRFGLTRRTLENRFKTQTGITPKEYCSIVQFRSFFERTLIKENRQEKAFGKLSLTEGALDVGYYDQSHLVRNFKKFAGLTPRQYLENSFHLEELGILT